MADFYIKEDNTKPEIQATLKDADGSVINLTGHTVRFHMIATGTAGGTAKVDAAATIVTAASGIVKYTWQAGDTDTPGDYDAEFEVTYSGGGIETFPNDGYLLVRVETKIA